jgi:glycosyltransferase involved in cell wall biosynthesis
MRIAVIGAKGLPPNQGGIEHYCAGLYPQIVSQGHSVDLFARPSYTRQPWFYQENYQGVRVITLPCMVKGGAEALTSAAIGATIASLKVNYDIVHFHALGPSLFSWIPRLAPSIPVVVTCHGLDWQRNKWGKFASSLIRAGEYAAVRYAHHILVVSEALKTYFKTQYSRDAVYIPNAPAGYAESDPSFTYVRSLGLNPGKYMVFLGRLVPEKCPDLLIQAFKKLQPQGWKLVLVGGASDTISYASTLLRMKGDSEDIVFTGKLQGSELAEVMRGSGLFVLPSSLEGMPLALLEAMQEGIPVITSDIPPLKSLIGQERGLLFEEGNLTSLMQALQWATQYPEVMTKMARNAQNYVKQHHTWEVITEAHLNLYELLAAGNVGSLPPAPQLDKAVKL